MSRETRIDDSRTFPIGTDLSADDITLARGGRALLVAVAVVAASTLAAVRTVLNAPATTGWFDLGTLYEPVVTAVLVATSVATVAVALARRDLHAPGTVGLLTVGVFGGLAAANDAAAVPSLGAITLGGVLALEPWNRPGRRRTTVAAGLTAGVASTLVAGVVLDALRPLAVVVLLGSLATTPLLADPDVPSWLAGLVAATGILLAGVVSPFVTGAVTLVVGGAAAAPLWLLALGGGGLVTTAAALARDHEYCAAAGGVLVLVAGVPVSLQRAVAVVFGLVLLLGVLAPREPEVATDG